MKNISFLLIVVFLSCNSSEKNETVITSADSSSITKDSVATAAPIVLTNERKIIAIRENVQRINNSKLRVESFSWKESGCVEDGKVNYYFSNDSIVKVTESGFIGDGGWTKAYYYRNGKFIFSFMQHIGGPAAMPIDTSEIRMYADNDSLVLQKRNNDSFDDLTKIYNSKSIEYKILNAYKDKNFAKVFCH